MVPKSLVHLQLVVYKVTGQLKTDFQTAYNFCFSPFPIQLENPHVIEQHQMMVGVVTKAPDGATLNSSYETR